MSYYGNPASSAVIQNAAGMAVIAAGVVGFAGALGEALDAARQARYVRAYGDALTTASVHADSMERLARAAIEMLAALEVENSELAEACRQRQEVIDHLMLS
ncbi:MAG: hypothetical protein ACK43M_11625 [Allorhizobium sp.]